jgi:hypothetical protein
MKNGFFVIVAVLFMAAHLLAQLEPAGGNCKTWFVTLSKAYGLPIVSAGKPKTAQLFPPQADVQSMTPPVVLLAE